MSADRVESGGDGGASAGATATAATASGSRRGPHGETVIAHTASGGKAPGRRGRWIILGSVVGLAALLFAWKGRHLVEDYFGHVSTDDAFVTGDASTVGSRIVDVVEQVFVQDNDFVARGALLVRLDPAPYRVRVEQRRSALEQARLSIDQMVKALETSQAQLEQARDQVRSSLAGLEEAWRGVEGQQEQVRFRVASLRAEVAALRSSQAELALSQKEYDRVKQLVAQQSATHAELDQRWASLQSAREKVKAEEQKVQQARAMLALGPDYQHPEQIPDDLERTGTDVRRAVASGQQILAQLGIATGPQGMEPESLCRTLRDLTGKTSETWIDEVPSVRSARARVDQAVAALGGRSFDPSRPHEHPAVVQARKDLEDAELQLGYTEVRAPITGYVNRRSVNPGDNVMPGQALLSIQPLSDVYIVANFKETQLADLEIGQPVAIHVDAYPGRPIRGRVSGFAPATGAASSMLPPENATGNFVKVVQRLPVRIDLIEPNPRETPLFVGMSVIPEVDIKARPTGPDAGERLRGAVGRAPAREVRR